jgi:hypothetical protein
VCQTRCVGSHDALPSDAPLLTRVYAPAVRCKANIYALAPDQVARSCSASPHFDPPVSLKVVKHVNSSVASATTTKAHVVVPVPGLLALLRVLTIREALPPQPMTHWSHSSSCRGRLAALQLLLHGVDGRSR